MLYRKCQVHSVFQRFTNSTPITSVDDSFNTNESVSALSDFVMSKYAYAQNPFVISMSVENSNN